MSIGQLEDGVSRVPLWSLYRKRVTWLVLLVFANLFSGAGIAYFEDTIAAQVALVFFLPLLIGSGGNAGAQAATLMVRGMATGDIGVKDWSKMLGRELLVAGSLGITMAIAVAPIGIFRGGEAVAIIVALSMVTIVLFGSMIGMCLPFVLERFKVDPATASAPLVTTLIDASGVLIYFTIATAILSKRIACFYLTHGTAGCAGNKHNFYVAQPLNIAGERLLVGWLSTGEAGVRNRQ